MTDHTYIIPKVDEIRTNGNRLKNSGSVYLRQHANNPVDWYPWGNEAIQRAQSENKPIFLSIGYSSCHWCHVMEEKVFEVEMIADYMNHHFVNIKVDREQRPDLDAVYMQSVQILTGSGGWPMSVFLTPDLKPFYGGTYFPPDTFFKILQGIHQIYTKENDKVSIQASQLYDSISRNPVLQGGNPVTLSALKEIGSQAVKMLDSIWGGFKAQAKFPTPVRWHYLLHMYRKTGKKEYGDAVQLTLDKMATGGIQDQVGGGFHRYTVEQTWLVPHFEKMLYDNAQLASLYCEAYAVFRKELYAQTAKQTLDWMIRELSDPEGGFYGSYDADSGGEEGSFYIWEPEELKEIAGETDGLILADLLGITGRPNFEGKFIPTRRVDLEEVSEKHGIAIDELEGLLEKHRQALLDYRAKRTWPGLDKKIVTAWNGLALSAFAQGYRIFSNEIYKEAAEKTASFLWKKHRQSSGELLRSSTDDKPGGSGVLDDYSFLIQGLLDLFQATGSHDYLEKSLELVDYVNKHFSSENGAYYFTPDFTEAPAGRQIDLMDNVEPSGNSVMVKNLLLLSEYRTDEDLRKQAERLLGGYSDIIQRAGMEVANWADTALLLCGPLYTVVLAGPGKDKNTLEQQLNQALPPYALLIRNKDNSKDLEAIIPSIQGKTAVDKRETAYICQYGSCNAPVTGKEEMLKQLRAEWTY